MNCDYFYQSRFFCNGKPDNRGECPLEFKCWVDFFKLFIIIGRKIGFVMDKDLVAVFSVKII